MSIPSLKTGVVVGDAVKAFSGYRHGEVQLRSLYLFRSATTTWLGIPIPLSKSDRPAAIRTHAGQDSAIGLQAGSKHQTGMPLEGMKLLAGLPVSNPGELVRAPGDQ